MVLQELKELEKQVDLSQQFQENDVNKLSPKEIVFLNAFLALRKELLALWEACDTEQFHCNISYIIDDALNSLNEKATIVKTDTSLKNEKHGACTLLTEALQKSTVDLTGPFAAMEVERIAEQIIQAQAKRISELEAGLDFDGKGNFVHMSIKQAETLSDTLNTVIGHVSVERDLGSDECPNCGGHDLKLITYQNDGLVGDGDSVVCRECGTEGFVSFDIETEPYVNWDF